MDAPHAKDPAQLVSAIRQNIERAVVGKGEAIDLVLTALLSRGHVLVEDVPGVGKTTLVRALAASLGCSFQRIQFTPDVTPSDVVGFTIPDLATGELRYRQGAIMHQIILADEINRTSPKTQSCLLEVMQEAQVTVDGATHPVPKPFMVLATQNPVEHVGTYALPEAQLDRFFMRISLGYPGISDEIAILDRYALGEQPTETLEPVCTAEEVEALQAAADGVHCSPKLKEYIALITGETRKNEDLALGASPRATIALMRAAKSYALLQGRDYAVPDDVITMAEPVVAHRLLLRPEAKLREMTAERVLRNIINRIKVPDAAE